MSGTDPSGTCLGTTLWKQFCGAVGKDRRWGKLREKRTEFLSQFGNIVVRNINENNFQENKCISFANACGILSKWFLFRFLEFVVVERRRDFVQIAADVLQKLRDMEISFVSQVAEWALTDRNHRKMMQEAGYGWAYVELARNFNMAVNCFVIGEPEVLEEGEVEYVSVERRVSAGGVVREYRMSGGVLDVIPEDLLPIEFLNAD